MSKRHKHKHKKSNPRKDIPVVNCLDCSNCQYLGEGDYLCDARMKIIIQDFDMSMAYRPCSTFSNI